MEGFSGSGFDGVGSTVRKKRSNTFRRPRPDSQSFPDARDHSSLSSTPPSDNNVSKVSSDENTGYDASSRKKEFNLNQCASRVPSSNRADGETTHKKIKKEDGTYGEYDRFYSNGSSKGSNDHVRSGSDSKRCSEGVLAPANWKNTNKVTASSELHSRKTVSHLGNGKSGESRNSGQSVVGSDGIGNESKLKKVKLKVGGVTRTIHAKSTSDVAFGGGSSIKSSRASDAPRPRQKLILQDNSDDDNSPPPPEKSSGLQGIPWKDFSRSGFSLGKRDDSSKGKMSEDSGRHTDKSEPVRKSKRVPKRRVLDDAFDEDAEDEEIRYLERLKTSKSTADYGAEYEDDEDEGSRKHKRILKVSNSKVFNGEYDEDVEEYGSSRSGKDGKKKSRLDRVSEDTDYVDEEEPASDGEPEAKRKKLRKESVDTLMESKKETSLTTRQRAMQSGKDVTSGTGASLIEFPNGLPPAPPRKQKEKLSEVEQQLKKAEAAQRRRMQVEKAARESEAEAIRKILGQDSSRKKREDKNKKRRDELAQEKAANAITLASNTVRWIMGPTGTVVTFPKEVGLPSIFDTKPRSYPPPREKCAGPSCSNTYKYRDSKTNLPLCSLQCYKAIHENMQSVTSC
ncbi:nucleolar protein dao-5-like [Macadamia integrifolia]|uniref:nucleolar protein dao-5-like n=1 Tax=Macadamia integrifolia TaxID=60698 RepID=UPI001C4EAA27|nr:nucleolar protein dao-5-like [Macadamia integrifolia]XP_042517872.1 nucleolar protein dao-5-like [Macadamia integrifolia]